MTVTLSLFRKAGYSFQLTFKRLRDIFVLRHRRVTTRGDQDVDLHQNISAPEREIEIANIQIITSSLKRL